MPRQTQQDKNKKPQQTQQQTARSTTAVQQKPAPITKQQAPVQQQQPQQQQQKPQEEQKKGGLFGIFGGSKKQETTQKLPETRSTPTSIPSNNTSNATNNNRQTFAEKQQILKDQKTMQKQQNLQSNNVQQQQQQPQQQVQQQQQQKEGMFAGAGKTFVQGMALGAGSEIGRQAVQGAVNSFSGGNSSSSNSNNHQKQDMSQQQPAQPQQPKQDEGITKLLKSVGCAAIAAVITVTFIHPIDVVKTRLQVSGEAGRQGGQYTGVFQTVKALSQENGLRTFYKGIGAAYLREMSYTSLRLGLYSPVKDLFAGKDNNNPSALIKFLSGATSGAIAASAGNPFDVLKTRMMASEVKGLPLSHFAGELYQKHGLKGFYKGLSANISRGIVLNATKLGTYDIIKTNLKEKFKLGGLPLHFFSAFCAGFFMTLTVTPFDMVRTRLMNQPSDRIIYTSLGDCFTKVIKSEGWTALYKGFYPVWGRFAPTTVLQLVILEQLRNLFGMKQI